MLSLDPPRPRTRRLVFFYVFLGLSVLATIGVAIWLMPRVPNVWGLRDWAGWGLFFVLMCVWGVVAKFVLSEEEVKRLYTKREREDD